jgi:NADH dehydrogenase
MAGAIAEVARQTLQHDFRRIDPRSSRIVLIEAGPRLLPPFAKRLSDYAKRSLESMGVEIMTGKPVTGCDANGVSLGDERIEAATVIWAAGVVASPAAEWIGAEHDKSGRIVINDDLTVPGHPEIFAIGDTAAAKDGNGRPLPGIAPAAKQMGAYAGKAIAARVAGRTGIGPFKYRHYGDLATIGRKAAVVQIGSVQLTGFVGWVFWSVAHIYFLIGLKNRFVVAATWLWSYLTFQRSARLISNPYGEGAPPRD